MTTCRSQDGGSGCRCRLLVDLWIWPVETSGLIPWDRAVTHDGDLDKERCHAMMAWAVKSDGLSCQIPCSLRWKSKTREDRSPWVLDWFDVDSWVPGLWDELWSKTNNYSKPRTPGIICVRLPISLSISPSIGRPVDLTVCRTVYLLLSAELHSILLIFCRVRAGGLFYMGWPDTRWQAYVSLMWSSQPLRGKVESRQKGGDGPTKPGKGTLARR